MMEFKVYQFFISIDIIGCNINFFKLGVLFI